MAETILANVLEKKLTIEELFEWLTADNPEDPVPLVISQTGCTKADFVTYFLNYLREECRSLMPEGKDSQEKLGNKTPKSNKENKDQEEKLKNRNLEDEHSREVPIKAQVPNSHEKNQIGGESISQPGSRRGILFLSSSLSEPLPVMSMGPRLSHGGHKALSPMQVENFPPLPHHGIPGPPTVNHPNYQHSMGNVPVNSQPGKFHHGMSGPPTANHQNYQHSIGNVPANFQPGKFQSQQNQFGGFWNHSSIPKHPTQQLSPRQHFDNSVYSNRCSYVTLPHQGFNSNSHGLNQAHMEMSNPNTFSTSGMLHSSLQNASFEASSPVKFDDSSRNGTNVSNLSNAPFSPVSPLYANHSYVHCPSMVERSHNESRYSHDNSSIMNSSRTSTPKSSIGSGQKGGKSGQNRTETNFCLGDFITIEGQGSRKKSKKQLKIDTSVAEQKISELKVDGNEKSSTAKIKINEVKSPRRIKPTRLNVSNDKGSRSAEVFGVISRPTISNPKFVEAPSTDKNEEELTFEVERELLKLERQRQPKSEITNEIATCDLNQSISLNDEGTVIPNFVLVENREALDILASVYGEILKHNLMSNPMSELYFLVTLITTQYKMNKTKKKAKKKVTTDASNSLLESDRILEPEDDLGCSELSDQASSGTKDDDSTGRERKMSEQFSEDTNGSLSIEDSMSDLNLLTSESKSHSNYLNSPHNCVYFAIVVLLKQNYFLDVLDRATLKLFCENQQITNFRTLVQENFDRIYNTKCHTISRVKQIDSGSSQTNVCFQVETDNKETFPSSTAFTWFRKQRDLFYDILKDWEDNHLQPDWSFQRAMKNKISSLFALHTDAVNYCHFAKLFVSQLLVSTVNSGKTEDLTNDESLSFLKSLKHLNPEKLQQLKERLVTPLVSTGPVPQPTFPGIQEFYQEFILNAGNWKFYVILENTLIHEILELNDTLFARSDIEETTVDESTKQHFITCVCSLKLLAKFTSFTISLPFKSIANSPEWIFSQIQLRERVLPPVDLQNCLLDALANGRLSLTVPWIVQYLAILDSATLSLPHYAKTGEMLYWIYRICSYNNSADKSEKIDVPMSRQTSMLMMFTIGWLFELENFPQNLYAHWQMVFDPKKFSVGDKEKNLQAITSIKSTDERSCKQFETPKYTLDQMNIIDDRAFYECCPFLAELRILLISGNTTLNNSNANRHITPVSSQLSQSKFTVKSKNLQMQLEEAFLHGQPSSTRKTVDFVSERIASCCVKYICNVIIPAAKERNMTEYIKSLNGEIEHISRDEDSEEYNEMTNTTPPRTKKKVVSKAAMDALATAIKEDVKRESLQTIPDMCRRKITKSMESLLPDDVLPAVRETCAAIARRIAVERIAQWIDSHIVESVFLKNMNVELKNILKNGDNDPVKENHHNEEAPAPTDVIEMMRNAMWELLEKKNRWAELSVDSINRVLKSLHQTLTEREDIMKCSQRTLLSMNMELCLLLISHRPDLFTTEVQRKFMDLWKSDISGDNENKCVFAKLLCPRNIRLITSTSNSSVLRVFSRFLQGLLRENLLSIDSLSDQCVAIFRQDWPEPVLKNLSQCLKDVIAEFKCTGADAERIKYLIGWIAETCDEMEIYD